MAETDVFYEFGREPGFSRLVYSPDISHMLHIPHPNLISDSGLGNFSPIVISIERIRYIQRMYK